MYSVLATGKVTSRLVACRWEANKQVNVSDNLDGFIVGADKVEVQIWRIVGDV